MAGLDHDLLGKRVHTASGYARKRNDFPVRENRFPSSTARAVDAVDGSMVEDIRQKIRGWGSGWGTPPSKEPSARRPRRGTGGCRHNRRKIASARRARARARTVHRLSSAHAEH